MFKKLCFILIVILSFCLSDATKINYDNFKLVRLFPSKDSHLTLINQLKENADNQDFDIWNHVKGLNHAINVLISPETFEGYENEFIKSNLSFSIVNNNIQNLINEEKPPIRGRYLGANNVVGKFASYDSILRYMIQMANSSSSIAAVYSAGKTHENRDVAVMRLMTPTSKRSMWIDCGIHAREWVSISTCVWMIDRFISDYKNRDPVTVDLLNNYEIHILPMMNPDGYEFSRNGNRMWRKNRRPNLRSTCVGVDLNRNFGYKWLTGGSSTNPCSDVYAGPSANSEKETLAVQNIISSKMGRWDSYITIHSFGQYWFTPWGYSTLLPSDYNDLVLKAQIGARALKLVAGKSFSVGSSANLLYASSGGSEDWTKAVANIKYSYCIELRPDEYSRTGFLIPESEAPAAGEETYQGIKAMFYAIAKSVFNY